jgi:uncharacterized damage-inducible protein DinB
MDANMLFFTQCFKSEHKATIDLLRACPADKTDYRPHPINRSARELIEHLVGHIMDLKVILLNDFCEETLVVDFASPAEAADKMDAMWNEVIALLENNTSIAWQSEEVQLSVSGQPFVKIPRSNMMWFFFFDVIHHRGQLSTYVRPMGGKNPAVYGYSADTM